MYDAKKLSDIFKVLTAETRVKILQILKKQELCVNAISEELRKNPATVSQHLRILRNVELVKTKNRGHFVVYAINPSTMSQWRKLAQDLLDAKSD